MAIYDVIIIGGGIAGLSAAASLKGKVLLIERNKQPYNNIACAEWVPRNFPAKPVQFTNEMLTIYPGGEVTSKFPGKIIDRESFQTTLLSKLECSVHLGENVRGIENDIVITNRSKYQTNWIIGADGPQSILSKDFGFTRRNNLVATNFRVKLKKPTEKTTVIFSPEIEMGYGWCFPKSDLANIGVGVTGNIRKAIDFIFKYLKNQDMISEGFISQSAGLIPLDGLLTPIKGNKILIGDAGGFIDPVTGAGIAYAWDTGKLAASLINGEISRQEFSNSINVSYLKFLNRRREKRKVFEEEWSNINKAVKKSWIAFSRG